MDQASEPQPKEKLSLPQVALLGPLVPAVTSCLALWHSPSGFTAGRACCPEQAQLSAHRWCGQRCPALGKAQPPTWGRGHGLSTAVRTLPDSHVRNRGGQRPSFSTQAGEPTHTPVLMCMLSDDSPARTPCRSSALDTVVYQATSSVLSAKHCARWLSTSSWASPGLNSFWHIGQLCRAGGPSTDSCSWTLGVPQGSGSGCPFRDPVGDSG